MVAMASDHSLFGMPMKYVSLLALTMQNTGAVLIMRTCPKRHSPFLFTPPARLVYLPEPYQTPGYTRSIPSESQYLTSTAVIVGEAMKVFVAASLMLKVFALLIGSPFVPMWLKGPPIGWLGLGVGHHWLPPPPSPLAYVFRMGRA